MSMTSRERVLCALRREQPDRVPYCELGVDRALASRLLGWQGIGTQRSNLEANPYSLAEAVALADRLQLDNLVYVLRAPVYVDKVPGLDERLFYGKGQLATNAQLVERAVSIVENLGARVIGPEEVRRKLNLTKRAPLAI